ncbi:hypothetical protein CgunFtcFv8_004841 [Champsocephalus gunnari]|uniref:Uncharacterized protein n=1 Tax=Champsocephalus gunnari TaxID=52237 RepID=A0AAN8E7V3_CHAGU|nr:hypothetical protein CgunFtcFv8_004834 [Champsocephalus gunnari]KAK5933195.1 hypothetical protein CgunFtcFv8_004841 [Champsocephalus gunnari]
MPWGTRCEEEGRVEGLGAALGLRARAAAGCLPVRELCLGSGGSAGKPGAALCSRPESWTGLLVGSLPAGLFAQAD